MRLEKVEKQKSHSRERNLEREHALFHSLGREVLSCLQSGEAQIRGRIAGPGGGRGSNRCHTAQKGGGSVSLRAADPRGQGPGASRVRGH